MPTRVAWRCFAYPLISQFWVCITIFRPSLSWEALIRDLHPTQTQELMHAQTDPSIGAYKFGVRNQHPDSPPLEHRSTVCLPSDKIQEGCESALEYQQHPGKRASYLGSKAMWSLLHPHAHTMGPWERQFPWRPKSQVEEPTLRASFLDTKAMCLSLTLSRTQREYENGGSLET